jgi:hypothetical protein
MAKDTFSEVHCDVPGSIEEGMSGLGRVTGECWGPVGTVFWD